MKSACRLPSRTAFGGRLCSPPLVSCAAALFLVASLQAQEGKLDPRQVYYKPQTAPKADQNTDSGKKTAQGTGGKHTTSGKKTTKPSDPVTGDHTMKVESPRLGMMYKIEQLQASGGTIEVDPDTVFKTGDAIRLLIGVNMDAYVYLVTVGASGEGSILFPQPGEYNHLKAFQPTLVPAAPADPIIFEEPAGSEILYVRVSRTPVKDLQKLLAAVPKSQMDDLFNKDRLEARDLGRGKYQPVETPSTGDKNEWAIYTVNYSTDPGAEVVQKFQLRHK